MAYRTCIALSIAIAALATALAEAPAQACSPQPPGVSSTVPKDGSTYPGNAAVLFYGNSISLDKVTVTVDGQPASFGPAPSTVPTYAAGLMATITPVPMPGQKVVIEGDFCAPGGAQCPPKTLTFTAGPPDTQAPPAFKVTSFDVYDYPDYKSSGGDCTTDSDLGYWVDIQAAPAMPEPGDSARFHVVEAFRPATPDKVEFFTASAGDGDMFRVNFRTFAAQLGGATAPEAFCFRASSFDTAGNVTGTTPAVCAACRYRVDTQPGSGFGPPPEPMWTSADAYPEGPCSMGTSSASAGSAGSGSASAGSSSSGSTGGDDVEIGGCGCHVGGDAPGAAPWLPALALAAGVFMRSGKRRARGDLGLLRRCHL